MRWLAVVFAVFLAGCGLVAQQQADDGIARYFEARDQIRLGDDRDSVLAVLQPINETIPPEMRRPSDQFKRDGALVEIYYARSARFPDNRSTDDEYTPYVFVNGVLESIGWQALGGPATRAQPRASTPPPPGFTYGQSSQQAQRQRDDEMMRQSSCKDAIRRHELGVISMDRVESACTN